MDSEKLKQKAFHLVPKNFRVKTNQPLYGVAWAEPDTKSICFSTAEENKDINHFIVHLVHEATHARLFNRGIVCNEPGDKIYTFHEIIAFRQSLKFCIRHKFTVGLKFAMNVVRNGLYFYTHEEASAHVMQSKLWKKCEELVNG